MSVIQPMDQQEDSIQASLALSNQRSPKDFHYWATLRRTNPNLYYTPRTQKLMVTDATALGNHFFHHQQRGKSL